MLGPADFFDLEDNPFSDLFQGAEYVWDGLKNLKDFIGDNLRPNVKELRRGRDMVEYTVVLYKNEALISGFEIDLSGKKAVVRRKDEVLEGASIIYAGAFLIGDDISIGNGTVIEPTALIKGPTVIGDNTEVRHGAYVRGDVLVGHDCVVGHTTEMKSSVMLGGSKAGHFAYIGDSILGKVNLGAGTKLANLKVIDSQVIVKTGSGEHRTGLRKFGAILADGVETGCNSVTAPGTLLGRKTILYPNGTARGYYAPGMIIKVRQNQSQMVIDGGQSD